ncbi:MAG: geranylgeranylglycerol-phosphate geranylgeranyltransferase [Bacteroidetes bacterium]|nr:geranylgeranylglycerol-phosphate geranylgeranyltransferase [Bacteroidota bacterium]
MQKYLQLVRWPNLLMIALLQYLLRHALIIPILLFEDKGVLLTEFEFFILVISCVLIAAGGYIINDVEDINIDALNKPEKKLIENQITKEKAINLYTALTFLGVLGGFFLSYVKGYAYIGIIYLITAGMLYFYSTSYKCIPLLGNLIISILSAMVVIIVIVPEPFAKDNAAVMLMIALFAFFSFINTFIREIVKDIEDLEGDKQFGCSTMASSLGLKKAKWICIILTFLIVSLLIFAQIISRQWESLIPFLYICIFIDIPYLILLRKLYLSENKSDFNKASFWIKLIMFTGIISLLIFNFSF